jgi:phosphoribosylamine---glycine ligase
MSKNILILGNGGRENAIAWKISQSYHCGQIFIAPGNPGTANFGINVPISPNQPIEIIEFCTNNGIDLVIIGPEEPLVLGVADAIREAGFACIGPGKIGAQLEGSKAFSKGFMERHNIPTANFREFYRDQKEEAIAYLSNHDLPIVIKADGLAAGKGVIICQNHEESFEALEEIFSGKFGKAGEKVVIEQFLDGVEFSVFALTDGNDYILLPIAKDYKRIGELDTGLNTGGMGAVSPVPFVNDVLMEKVISRVIEPTVLGLKKESIPYLGFIFFGLISVKGEPFVIEYNARLGDPETEAVLPRWEGDMLETFLFATEGKLKDSNMHESSFSAVTIMAVSGGYPESFQKGIPIKLPSPNESIIFHSGTKIENDILKTSGGRVLAITTLHADPNEARKLSLGVADAIQFEGKYFRRDIGLDIL